MNPVLLVEKSPSLPHPHRAIAFDVLKAYRDGGNRLPPRPSDEAIEEMTDYIIGEGVPRDDKQFLQGELGMEGQDPYAHTSFEGISESARRGFHVVIIGAGMSGLLAAIRLDQEHNPYTIIEKNSVSPQNAGGFAALIEIEELDGRKRKFLLDSGWSYKWNGRVLQTRGHRPDAQEQEIEAIIVSHEHFDHFWGIPVTYKYDPTITTYIPEGFYPEGLQYLQDAGHRL